VIEKGVDAEDKPVNQGDCGDRENFIHNESSEKKPTVNKF